MLPVMTHEQVLEAWRRGGASRDRVLVQLTEEGALDWAGRLIPGPAEARRLAASLLGRSPHPTDALLRLRTLATDEDRYTREAAVQAGGALLKRDFDEIYPILGTWRTEAESLVRRAAVLVCGVAADPLRLDWVEPLLRLLDPLLRDRAPEVRSAVEGVLAHAFFPAYPDDVFEQLTAWSASYDEQVLWHVSTTLGHAPQDLARRALIVLRRAALDERRYVRAAAARALVRLAATCPEAVGTELRRWLGDPERLSIARAALARMGEPHPDVIASGSSRPAS